LPHLLLLDLLSLPRFRRLRLRLRCRQPRALGLREVIEVLLLTETLVVVVAEAGVENQEVDGVDNVVGEAGDEVGITEGEVVEDVESNIS